MVIRSTHNAITKTSSLNSPSEAPLPKSPKSPKQETTEKTAQQIFNNPEGNIHPPSCNLSEYQFSLEERESRRFDSPLTPFPLPLNPASPRTLSSTRERALLNKVKCSTKNALLKEIHDLLQEAIEINSKSALQNLLEKTQFPLNACTFPNKQTLLHLACQGEHTTIISLLASQDVTLSLKTRDIFGMTPLDYMRKTNNSRALIECTAFYISNNQNPKITDPAKKRNEPPLLLLKFFLISLDSTQTTTSWVLEQLSCTENKKIKCIYAKFASKPIQVVPYEVHKSDNAIEISSIFTLWHRDSTHRYAVISEGESTPVLLAIPQFKETGLNTHRILQFIAPKYLKKINANQSNALNVFMEAISEPKKWKDYCQNFTEDTLVELHSIFRLLPEHCLAHLFERGVEADHVQLTQKALEGIRSNSSGNFSSQNLLHVLISLHNINPDVLHFSENDDFLARFGNNLADIILLSQPNEQYELLKFFLSLLRSDANWKDKDKRLVLFNAFADTFLSNKALTLVPYVLFLKFTPNYLLKPLLNGLSTSFLAQFCIKHESVKELFEEVFNRLENLAERVEQADRNLTLFDQNHAKAIETITQTLCNQKINLGPAHHYTSTIPEREWGAETFGDNLGHIIGHLNNSCFPRTELKTAKFDTHLLTRAIPHFESLKHKFSPLITSKYAQLLEKKKFKEVNNYLGLVISLLNNGKPILNLLKPIELGISKATIQKLTENYPNRLNNYKYFLQNLQTALTVNNGFRAFLIKIILEKNLAKNILLVLYVENLFNEALAGSLLNHLRDLNPVDRNHVELASRVIHFSILLHSSQLKSAIIAVCEKIPPESRTDKMKAFCRQSLA